MNGNAFSIKTNDEAYDLAVYLAETDAEWVYNVAPFDPQRHQGAGSTISLSARASNEFFVVEVYDEDGEFLGPL